MRTIVLLSAVAAAAAFSPVAMRRPVLASPMRAACAAQPAQIPRLATVPRMAEAAAAPEEDGIMETLKTGSFFALWYLFNIGYNIYNKKALNALAIPYTIALLQLAVGIPYAGALWLTGLRKTPKLSKEDIKTLIPVSLGHLGTHIGAVVSLGAGAVSFTHIVKASEPVVSSALRGILAKKTMGDGVGENMTEANIYAVLTILATIFILPITFALEPPAVIKATVDAALGSGLTAKYLWTNSLLAGAFYYLYNEVAFLALGRVNPVTHAIGNTVKRVVIIIASVIAFKTPISTLGVIGSSIAIAGTLLYSLAKSKFG